MRITNNINFQPLQANKAQKPAFGALVWFETLPKKEIRQHAASYWAYGCTENIKNLQTDLRKFFTEERQAGHKLLNEIFGSHERVKVGLKHDTIGLALHIEGSESGIKKIYMDDFRKKCTQGRNWGFNILDNTKELLQEIRKS